MKWLRLTGRGDPSAFNGGRPCTGSGSWYYPTFGVIEIEFNDYRYRLSTYGPLASAIITHMRDKERPFSFPDEFGNYIWVNTHDLENLNSDPQFHYGPRAPTGDRAAEKEVYLATLPDFGQF